MDVILERVLKMLSARYMPQFVGDFAIKIPILYACIKQGSFYSFQLLLYNCIFSLFNLTQEIQYFTVLHK